MVLKVLYVKCYAVNDLLAVAQHHSCSQPDDGSKTHMGILASKNYNHHDIITPYWFCIKADIVHVIILLPLKGL